MSKEVLQKLNKYADGIKSKLAEKTLPEKQKNRPAQYKQFLEKELSQVNSKIESMKISGVPDKK